MKHLNGDISSCWLTRLMMLCVMTLFLCVNAQAQGHTIKGKVISADDKSPLIGATVLVTGTNSGTTTDTDGNFTITHVPKSGTLDVSYIGYTSKVVPIVASKTYSISLEAESLAINDVVVVGYGTMRKKELTGAVVRVDNDQLSKLSTSDVATALQGQIAGVNVQASSGQPGEAANIQIRGVTSITGANSPLFVVDGVPYEDDPGLSTSEIASIDVLKDAASAAIYGTRGAGGVILITTKEGQKGAVKTSVDAYYGIQKITSRLDLAGTNDSYRIQMLGDLKYLAPNDFSIPSLTNNALKFLNNTNAVDIVEQDNQPIYNISANISGGVKDLTCSLVANYFDQEGVVYNTGFNRLNLRANAKLQKKNWTVTASISLRDQNQSRADGQLYSYVYSYAPYSNMFDPDDQDINMGSDNDTELLASSYTLQKFKTRWDRNTKNYNYNFSVDYKILPGLSFNSRFSSSYTNMFTVEMDPLFEMFKSNGQPYLNPNLRSGVKNSTSMASSMTAEQMLNYSKRIKKHDIKATAVFSAEKYKTEMYSAFSEDLITNELPTIGATTGDKLITGGPNRETTILGMLARVQYSYDSRYLFSASVRRDGSSRFVKENRWGIFPSVSAGWNISEEKFWTPMEKVVSSLKLRASMGTTGNQNFADYTAFSSITPGYDYAFGDDYQLGMTQTEYSNVNVMWETTQQINFGIDAGFLNGRLNFTADIYQSNKKDMLFGVTVPPVAGVGSNSKVTLNVGNMTNKGAELALRWNDRAGDFIYSASFTAASNINEITSMPGSTDRVVLGSIGQFGGAYDVTFLSEGYEAGAYFLYPTDGVINTDEKLEQYQKLDGKADSKMGDRMYVDTNKDGAITEADRVYCGSGAPECELGFNTSIKWKSFDFSTNWYASLGNDIFNGSRLLATLRGRSKELLYQWSPDNPFSTIPNTLGGAASSDNWKAYSDIYIEDGSFLRLKNVVLGYTLPRKITQKIMMNKLRVYIAADNIWTLTKYQGYDPEVGNDGLARRGLDYASYPITAQIRGGIQITF